MKQSIVTGMGEALWDMLPEGKKIGGAPANFAYHISQFGIDSRVVSAVGKDTAGSELLENLRDKSLKGLIEKTDFPTGSVEVEVDEKGIPCYNIREDVAWDHIPFTPQTAELARQTQAVCFGSLAQRHPASRSTIHRFLDTMPDGDEQYKIFDINLRQGFYTQEIISTSLQKCNVLKINDEELDIVTRLFALPGTGQEERCRTLLKRYALKALILTCGARGSFVFTPEETSYRDTPKVEVADTVGAGDSFTAAFTAAILSGGTVREAHRLAVDVSAYVCTQKEPCPCSPGYSRNGHKTTGQNKSVPKRNTSLAAHSLLHSYISLDFPLENTGRIVLWQHDFQLHGRSLHQCEFHRVGHAFFVPYVPAADTGVQPPCSSL